MLGLSPCSLILLASIQESNSLLRGPVQHHAELTIADSHEFIRGRIYEPKVDGFSDLGAWRKLLVLCCITLAVFTTLACSFYGTLIRWWLKFKHFWQRRKDLLELKEEWRKHPREDLLKPRKKTTKPRVTFDLRGNTFHEVVAYSEVYGMHPNDFHFDKRQEPPAWCIVGDAESEGDSGEDELSLTAKSGSRLLQAVFDKRIGK
jgi:hypothetical protein